MARSFKTISATSAAATLTVFAVAAILVAAYVSYFTVDSAAEAGSMFIGSVTIGLICGVGVQDFGDMLIKRSIDR